MACRHLQQTYFLTKEGDCDQCLKEKLQRLEEEIRRLRRDLQAAQIDLGKRQEVD